MSNIPVARRYARALLDAAGPEADQILEQLDQLASVFAAAPDLKAATASAVLNRTERLAAAETIIKAMPGLLPKVQNLIRLLCVRRRFGTLDAVALQYRDLVDERVGRVRGRVRSAAPLADEQLEAIRREFETLTSRKVVVEASVDRDLLGGVVARVGSTLYDGSLRGQLGALAARLSNARVPEASGEAQ
jgi:F-type H+-transporting ATPase subunit delta